MLLSALILATALQAIPSAEFPATPLAKPPIKARPHHAPPETLLSDRQVEAWKARLNRIAHCGANGLQNAQGAPDEAFASPKALAPRQPAKGARLGDLPMASHTLTVLRTEDGCPVSSTVRFNVGR